MVRPIQITEGVMISAMIPSSMQKKLKEKGINLSKFIRQAYEAFNNDKWSYDYMKK